MKWHITRKRMLAIIVVLFLVLCSFGLWGCLPLTRDEAENVRKAAGAATGAFGLPPVLGESIAGLVILISNTIAVKMGEARGRRKERACHVPPVKA